jgi:bifunctional DNA-binding transcriptional regulator/antitoxin component of YhaV-PrlF toxin-antitoxin module
MSDAEIEKVVSVSSRGHATIPKEFREALGIDTPGRVKFVRPEEGRSSSTRSILSKTSVEYWKARRTNRGERQSSDWTRNEPGTKLTTRVAPALRQ